MKCPHCIDQGVKSEVYIGPGSTTCLGHTPYYDREGVYHSHDPNWHSTSYHCSNGHKWGIASRRGCPATGCDFGKGDVRIQGGPETTGENA